MKKYYVYELIDPRSDKPFYVGKGSKLRMYVHVKSVKNGYIPNDNKKLRNKINKILKLGLKIKYKKVFLTDNEQEAYSKEKVVIKEIGLSNLCNILNGGADTSRTKTTEAIEKWRKSRKGYKHSEETKQKIGLANKGKSPWIAGKHHSDETRKKLSEINKGKTLSEETKKKLSEINMGKTVSVETRRKIGNSHLGKKHNSDKIKKWASENREHYYKMSKASKTPEAIEKWRKSRKGDIKNEDEK